MTTYTTPQFSSGLADRSTQAAADEQINATRAAPGRPVDMRDDLGSAGLRREPGLRADGQPVDAAAVRAPEWSPGAAGNGVPKAAIGTLGAALVGGIALAVVLIGPGDHVVKPAARPAVAATAPAADTGASATLADASTDAAVARMNRETPAAGPADMTAPDATNATAAAVTSAAVAPAPETTPAPVGARTAPAPAPAHATTHRNTAEAPAAAAAKAQAVATPTAVAPQPEPVMPAMRQTPDTPTVTPPADPATDTGISPAPAPAPDGQ